MLRTLAGFSLVGAVAGCTGPAAPLPPVPVLFVRAGTSIGDCGFLGGTQARVAYASGAPVPAGCDCEPLPSAEEALERLRTELETHGRTLGGSVFFVSEIHEAPAPRSVAACCPARLLEAEVYVYDCPEATRRRLVEFADPFLRSGSPTP